jgi:hypothetical protein
VAGVLCFPSPPGETGSPGRMTRSATEFSFDLAKLVRICYPNDVATMGAPDQIPAWPPTGIIGGRHPPSGTATFSLRTRVLSGNEKARPELSRASLANRL